MKLDGEVRHSIDLMKYSNNHPEDFIALTPPFLIALM
jgi:hypothetical protein